MKIFNNIFPKKNIKIGNKETKDNSFDQYYEIGKLVKEARIQKNLSIKELSNLSKIPESSIYAIENNIKNLRPKFPFIRSILLKPEICLSLKNDTLIVLLIRESNTLKKGKKNFLIRKFDFINSWYGSIFYFVFLIFILLMLNRYFISNMSNIEFQIIEEKVNEK